MQPSCVVKLVAFFCVEEWGGGQFGLPWGPPDERFGMNQKPPTKKKEEDLCGRKLRPFFGGAVMSGFEGL